MIIGMDIFILSIIKAETAGNDTQPDEAQLLIQPDSPFIGADHGIELQNSEAQLPGFIKRMKNQALPDSPASGIGVDGIAGVGDMAAPSHIIRMEDIQPVHHAAGYRHPCKALPFEKRGGRFRREGFRLGKGRCRQSPPRSRYSP